MSDVAAGERPQVVTLVTHTLVTFPRSSDRDWMTWQLDYTDHVEVLGQVALRDAYYFPPRWLKGPWARLRGRRVIEVDVGFFAAELRHRDLLRLCQAPGTLRDESWVAGLPKSAGYAVVWLEVY